MLTEDYVSFEIAKLLKEKGFNEYCRTIYNAGVFCSIASLNCRWNERYGEIIEEKQNSDFGIYDNAISAPTLQMAMKWLREKHDQNVTVKAHNNIARLKTIYYAEVQNLSEPAEKGFCVNGCIFKDTYEEACESGIRYCLENLI